MSELEQKQLNFSFLLTDYEIEIHRYWALHLLEMQTQKMLAVSLNTHKNWAIMLSVISGK